MARRKKDQGSWAFVVALVAIFFLAYVAPALLAGWWIYAEYQYAATRRRLEESGTPSDDHFSSARTHWASRMAMASGAISALHSHADASGVLRRVDGAFDNRSKLGRQANAELAQHQDELDGCTAEFASLVSCAAHREAARSAVIGWSGAAAIAYFKSQWTLQGVFAAASVCAFLIGAITYFTTKSRLSAA